MCFDKNCVILLTSFASITITIFFIINLTISSKFVASFVDANNTVLVVVVATIIIIIVIIVVLRFCNFAQVT